MNKPETNRLIETCMEGGPLTEAAIDEALKGQLRQGVALAVISWIEYSIANERALAEARGIDAQTRTEACAAANALVTLRSELLQKLRVGTDQE
jgi:hypothetical protein